MITALSLAILVTASAATMDAETDRVSYSNCLVDFVGTHLDSKTSLSAFRTASKEACTQKRDALITSIKKDELEFGSTDQEATDYAEEEAGNVLFAFLDSYNSYLNSNTRPVKE